jgi:hypothetical protein
LFVVKYNANGDALWTQTAKAYSGNSVANSIVTDIQGNAYIVGEYSSKNFYSSNSAPSNDIFIAKFNPAGTLLWLKNFGGSDNDSGNGITISGNTIYITGNFSSTTIVFQDITLTNTATNGGVSNFFIAALDTEGNVLWAKSTKTNGNSYGVAITSDSKGQTYVTGNFESKNIIFGTDTLVNPTGIMYLPSNKTSDDPSTLATTFNSKKENYTTGNSGSKSINFELDALPGKKDIRDLQSHNFICFCTAFDSLGHSLWARCPKESYNAQVSDISIDSKDNCYLIGKFNGNIQFDSIALSNPIGGDYDIFVVKYNAAGNVKWAKSIGGSDDDLGEGITTCNENMYITGTFESSSLNFWNTVALHLGQSSTKDIFIAKFSGIHNAASNNHPRKNLFKIPDEENTLLDWINEQQIEAAQAKAYDQYKKSRTKYQHRHYHSYPWWEPNIMTIP